MTYWVAERSPEAIHNTKATAGLLSSPLAQQSRVGSAHHCGKFKSLRGVLRKGKDIEESPRFFNENVDGSQAAGKSRGRC
jgi:hypothetical protein